MLLAPALFVSSASAGQPLFPTKAGQCQWVRGKFVVANGSSVNRLFVSRTKHALALHDDDQKVPSAILRYWGREPFDHSLWGDFYVCARERYIRGHMQHIRILRTRRTVIADY